MNDCEHKKVLRMSTKHAQDIIRRAKLLRGKGYSVRTIAEQLGISASDVRRIVAETPALKVCA